MAWTEATLSDVGKKAKGTRIIVHADNTATMSSLPLRTPLLPQLHVNVNLNLNFSWWERSHTMVCLTTAVVLVVLLIVLASALGPLWMPAVCG